MLAHGFTAPLVQGTLTTLQLALSALAAALLLGLLGALCRLSGRAPLVALAKAYTTLIRAVPDLVIMLLLFFGLQIQLNRLTDWLGAAQLDIDPFAAGVLTLAFIYGAYFSETFRGAFQAIPPGQLEAARAFGMTPLQALRKVTLPQMLRHALPGLGNTWLVLIKSTALVSIIGLNDLVKASQDAGKGSLQLFAFTLFCAAIYLAISSCSQVLLALLERRLSRGLRRAG